MADNITLDAGTGGAVIKTDDDGVAHWQYAKLAYGADNTQTRVTATAGLPVSNDSSTFTVALSATDNAVLDTIDAVLDTINAKLVTGTVIGDVNLGATDNAVLDSIATAVELIDNAVSGTGFNISQIGGAAAPIGAGLEATALRVTLATDSTGQVTIDHVALDNAHSADFDTGAGTDTTTAFGIAVPASGGAAVVPGDATAGLKVNLGADNDVTLATLPDTGASDLAAINTATAATQTAVETLDNSIFADDAAFTLASDSVSMAGAIRDDSLSALTAIEGDAVPLRVNSTGALHVTGGGGGTQYNVDDAAGGTDTGTVNLAVRDDSLTTLTPIDGDYVPLRVNATGALHVTGGGGGTEYTEDSATPATITGTATLMERDDALTTVTPIEGDWIGLRGTAEGALWTQDFNSDQMRADLTTLAGAVSGSEVQVDVVTSALPTGAATAANQSTANTSLSGIQTAVELIDNAISGSEMQVDVVAALPAGTNAIGKLAANSGVDIGDVDVTSISAGSNLVGDVGISGARTSGGTTLYKNIDVDESEDQVKGTAGQVYWIHAMNLSAAVKYLKIYNATAATVVVGTTVPDLTFPIPTQGDTNGAGFTLSIPNGIAFGTAITIAATTGIADADSGAPGANEVVVNLGYA